MPYLKFQGNTIRMNAINRWWDPKTPQNCRHCNGSIEDIFHVMAECRAVKDVRKKLGIDWNGNNRGNYIQETLNDSL